MPSYYFNERFYIVYNINLIMFYDLLIFIFMSYIKPQPASSIEYTRIVYSTIPTSNHNPLLPDGHSLSVVYRTIPTSNHNWKVFALHHHLLYIVLFLHQTTTDTDYDYTDYRCISYYSYIKPQLARPWSLRWRVVYRTIPTSNHNFSSYCCVAGSVVYRTIPTSNHNQCR